MITRNRLLALVAFLLFFSAVPALARPVSPYVRLTLSGEGQCFGTFIWSVHNTNTTGIPFRLEVGAEQITGVVTPGDHQFALGPVTGTNAGVVHTLVNTFDNRTTYPATGSLADAGAICARFPAKVVPTPASSEKPWRAGGTETIVTHALPSMNSNTYQAATANFGDGSIQTWQEERQFGPNGDMSMGISNTCREVIGTALLSNGETVSVVMRVAVLVNGSRVYDAVVYWFAGDQQTGCEYRVALISMDTTNTVIRSNNYPVFWVVG